MADVQETPVINQEPGSSINNDLIAALIQNRNQDVGFAAFDPCSLRLYLSQYIDPDRTFPKTTALLYTYSVSELVLSSQQQNDPFTSGISRIVQDLPCNYLSRAFFDGNKGMGMLETFANEESKSKLVHYAASYGLAFGAAGALLNHMTVDASQVRKSSMPCWGNIPCRMLLQIATRSNCCMHAHSSSLQSSQHEKQVVLLHDVECHIQIHRRLLLP